MAASTTASTPPRVGDTVLVPGGMHGTLKFVGPVAGKKGTFAGVQLAPEYAARGKNSGDVEGKQYFKTTVSGSGIFLPAEKAVKMDKAGSAATTPRTPGGSGSGSGGGLSSFNQGGRAITPAGGQLAGLPKPNFSQSVGAGMRPMSPLTKGANGRRESLPRPTSPLRKIQAAATATPTAVGKLTTPKTRPSLGLNRSVIGNGNGTQYKANPAGGRSASTNKFSQSLRQSLVTPSKGKALSPLGPEASFDEEEPEADTTTPTPTPLVVPAAKPDGHSEGEIRRLKESLMERDRQLRDQASSISEMEKSLSELQAVLPSLEPAQAEKPVREEEDHLSVDVVTLRATLREKNEKIKMLTAEFDANRADFRSTIDTLELASSETERVYEKRVDELLEEVRGLQDRSEDVAGLAEQMRQLEELVQELEEGLEDARRGEAEARGEVEFLRGEVERGRAEVRRLREGILDGGGGDGHMEEMEELRLMLEQKDDEVRGLKAIIQEINRNNTEYPTTNGNGVKMAPPAANYRVSRELERQITELKALLSKKNEREEELENELSRLRSNGYGRYGAPPFPSRNSGGASVGEKHRSASTNGSHRLSDRTVILSPAGMWHDASSNPSSPPKNTYAHTISQSQSQHQRGLHRVDEGEARLDERRGYADVHEEDADKSTSGATEASASSAALWCEICEKGGHDILTCKNMFGSKGHVVDEPAQMHAPRSSSDSQRSGPDVGRPAPLSVIGRKATITSAEDVLGTPASGKALGPPPSVPPPLPKPAPAAAAAAAKTSIEDHVSQSGMVAGKRSGAIDFDKWCALCERDGHDSVDCPFEDSF